MLAFLQPYSRMLCIVARFLADQPMRDLGLDAHVAQTSLDYSSYYDEQGLNTLLMDGVLMDGG